MSTRLRILYYAHTLRSDWNNGNAHFLRGLLRALAAMGHTVVAYEPEREWSLNNLLEESSGARSLAQFGQTYSELDVRTYPVSQLSASGAVREQIEAAGGADVVILHEWNPPELAQALLGAREALGYKLLFHDTHHRASSSPDAFAKLGLDRFNGVLAFGEALRSIYRERFGIDRVWTLHEAADTTVFHPLPLIERKRDLLWVGNWGDNERSAEIRDYLLTPAAALLCTGELESATIYGVRYPPEGRAALQEASVQYGGYLPNLDAPAAYATAALTVHVPRQQYSQVMTGIPTIRVFEALACGIPIISAPWQDTEHLFRKGDLLFARSGAEMEAAMRAVLNDGDVAAAQVQRARETVLTRHTCVHRAQELTAICEKVLA